MIPSDLIDDLRQLACTRPADMICVFSYDYTTGKISEDVAEQAEQTLRNINFALEEAGSSMKDVVRVRYILPKKEDFPQTWGVLKRWFGDVRPAATMVQAGLMKDEMKIEIEVTAKKSSSKPEK